jgi:hypothetical protein
MAVLKRAVGLRSGPEEEVMSETVIERITEEDARARRDEILRLIGGDVEAFRIRAYDYLLDASEQALFDELEDLDYLLSL